MRRRERGRASWGTATDEVVEGLWYVAHLPGAAEEARAVREPEPLPTRDRAGCCMFCTVRPEDTCATRPRTCDSDRIAKRATTAAA